MPGISARPSYSFPMEALLRSGRWITVGVLASGCKWILRRFGIDISVDTGPKYYYDYNAPKRYLFQTANSEFWADSYIVHKTKSGIYIFTSLINVQPDGSHVTTEVYAPIEAVHDYESPLTLQIFEAALAEVAELRKAQAEVNEDVVDRSPISYTSLQGYQ